MKTKTVAALTFGLLLTLSHVAPAAECLQAPGLISELKLGPGEPWCPIGAGVATAADYERIKAQIQKLDEQFKDVDPDELDSGATVSLYFGFQERQKWAQASGTPFSLLNREEVYALFNYIEWGYQGFNTLLWRGNTKYQLTRSEVKVLTAALAKLPPHQGKVYRGEIQVHMAEELAEIDSRISKYSLNKPYFFKGFMSTTLAKNEDARESYVEGRAISIEIVSKTGRFIAPMSSRPEEEEVLFRPGTYFKVLEIKKIPRTPTETYPLDYQWRIKMEEI